MALPVLVYTFVDNNGAEATTRMSVPAGISPPGVLALALDLAPRLSAVSDAVLARVRVRWVEPLDLGSAPGEFSDVKRTALFFYRDGDNAASFRLPSPSLLLAETSGLYAGVRITRQRLELLALLSTVEAIPSGALDPVGRPYGTTFTVGGIYNL